MKRWDEPPRVLVWISAACLLVGVLLTVVGSVRIGVTVDETFHVVRLQNFLDRGWYLLDDDFGTRGPGEWVSDSYVYAPVATLLLHVLNVAVGNEPWGQVSPSQDAYAMRHLGVTLFAFVTLAATSAMTRILAGSWRWAIVSTATLVCLPMWTGHAMFNVKDVPVATGYTLVTLGCIIAVTVRREARGRRVLVMALVAYGVLIAIGTRPAIWPGLAAAMACVIAFVLLRRRRSAEWWRSSDVGLGLAVGLVALACIYPAVFLHPDQWALGSTSESASYQGQRLRGYIPHRIVTTVPIVLLVFGLVGSTVRFTGRLGRFVEAWRVRDVVMAIIVLQAVLLPLLLIIRMPSLNGGLRHLLFAAPAVAVLTTAGVSQVLNDVMARAGRLVVSAVAAAGLVAPLVAQVQLFPYGYAYANPLADATGADLPADFWQASFREYVDDIATGDFVICGTKLDDDGVPLRQMPNGGQSWMDISQDCAVKRPLSVLAPHVPARDDQGKAAVPVQDTFLALLVYDTDVAEGCTAVAEVSRRRLLAQVQLSTAWRCPLMLREYPGPVTFEGSGAGATYLLGGWTASGGDPWVAADAPASLGFAVDGVRRDVTVEVTGESAVDVEFLLNNEPAVVESTDSGWKVRARGPLRPVGKGDNVVLTLVPDGGRARVSAVRLAKGAS